MRTSCADQAAFTLFLPRQFRKHAVAGDLMREIAAVGEQDDADSVRRYQADIGRCVVESAWLVDDVSVLKMNVLPGHRLPELPGHTKRLALRHLQRLPQLRIDRPAIDTGRNKNGHVARRGEHLAGPGEIEITLLGSGCANRRA